MNKCKYCGKILVEQGETVEAYDGQLFCGNACVINYIIVSEGTSYQLAVNKFNQLSETCNVSDILKEDLVDVNIEFMLSCTCSIPKHMYSKEAVEYAAEQLNKDIVDYLEEHYVLKNLKAESKYYAELVGDNNSSAKED